MPVRGDWLVFRLRWQIRACLWAGRPDAALRCVDRLLLERPSDIHALSTRAHLLAQVGDACTAIAALRHVLALNPQLTASWFNLGFLLERQGDAAAGAEAFHRAVRMDPRLDRAWYGLGLCLIRLHRWDEAVQALRRNTALQPMSPSGWYQLARVHAERQEPEEAERIIRHLRSFEPRVAAQLQRETGLGAAAT